MNLQNILDDNDSKCSNILLFLFYITVQFVILNGVSIYSLGDYFAIKLHHICTVVLFLYLITKGSFPKIAWPITLFLCVIGISSLVSYSLYFFNVQYVNLLYCMFLVITFSLAAIHIPYQVAAKIMRIVFTVSLFAILAKTLILWGDIEQLMHHGSRVVVFGLVSGGPNQEGGILALGAIFFLRRRFFFPFLLAVIALNILYISRGSILICMFVMAIHVFKGGRQNIIFAAIGVLSFLVISSLVITFAGDILPTERLIERFTNIGFDRGSLGRLLLWNGALEAFKENMFGYGMMNAVPMIEYVNNIDLLENNLHNVYLQITIDGGLHSLVAYFIMVIWVARKTMLSKNENIFGVFLVVYFIVGMLRFRAYDPFAFMMLGIFQIYVIRHEIMDRVVNYSNQPELQNDSK